ncbi:glucose sorbosone dehydrogenase [Microdochium trichocladiopsis]|uniref:Glucose sorbosone dehydrogenase n=1 Tax=Microdochium trichocladiopsis TaxID=1682393 RepID=A0A9P8YJ37_9PEZI|nr:glucose sorbosone dehydrogenase [Microdochium trichocladiopsis]KAH7040306.1 glucose sorbosone dehydrogenase [Microdochium trichocladiopsis]
MKSTSALAAGLACCAASAVLAQESCPITLQPAYPQPVVADGFTARLIASNLSRPRSLLFDASGKMLVLQQRSGIRRLGFTDHGSTCVEVTENTVVINDTSLTHGIALSNDGKTLFASSATQVFAWAYDAATGTISGDRKVVINGMGNSGHTTRTLLMSAKSPGTLIVSYGSNGNIDPEALNAESGVSQIRAFDVSTLPAQPIDYASGGKRLGWGLRNSVGVAEEPVTGGIYSVENSADELTRDGTDIHQNNPGEELNFHGTLNSTAEGGNHGYPTCFALWDTNVPAVGDLTTGSQFVTKTDGSNGATDAQCNSDYVSPRLTFQAHTAPLDIIFAPDGSAAYVSFHGSWNRDEPAGYRLSSIAFANGEPVAAADSKTALVDVLSNPSLTACPDNCFRPVGLAIDSANRLFMTSDSTGDIWVLDSAEAATALSGGGQTSSAASNPATKSSPSPVPTGAAAPSRGGFVGVGGSGSGNVAVVGAVVAAACFAFTTLMI